MCLCVCARKHVCAHVAEEKELEVLTVLGCVSFLAPWRPVEKMRSAGQMTHLSADTLMHARTYTQQAAATHFNL